MKNTQKGFFIPLIILVGAILIIGGAVYFKQYSAPQLDQTSDSATPSDSSNDRQNISSTTVTNSSSSGISGTAMIQYCSGVQMADPPPDYEQCQTTPAASIELKIKNTASGIEKSVITDKSGKFQVELATGTYTITRSGSASKTGGSFSISVRSGTYTKVNLKFQEQGI